MSLNMPIELLAEAEADAVRSYSVSRQGNCILVRGAIPMDDFCALAGLRPTDVVSVHLGRLAGATFAWGAPADVDALVAKLTAQADVAGLTPLQRWLAIGQRGASSDAIVTRLRCVQVSGDPKAHPCDVGDFARCVRLLDEVPDLQVDLGRMADLSPVWAALVFWWPALTELFLSEAPADWKTAEQWKMPKTYAMLQEVITAAKKVAP